MTLARDSWFRHAEGLAEGTRRRVEHDCGSGATMLVSRDAGAYKAWCFRCNDGATSRAPEPSMGERLLRMKAAEAADRRACALGAQTLAGSADIEDWPEKARAWLYKAGLGRHEIGKLGARYDPQTGRVVIPVYEDGRLVFWQARALDGRQPKYLAPAVDKSSVLPRWGNADAVTLTEDLLSAFKVGQVAEAWSLLGTYASPRVTYELLRRQCPVNVWLDPDAAGRRAAAKLMRQLLGFGLQTRNILSEADPKNLTYEQIRGKL
jgi:hypothetical protein